MSLQLAHAEGLRNCCGKPSTGFPKSWASVVADGQPEPSSPAVGPALVVRLSSRASSTRERADCPVCHRIKHIQSSNFEYLQPLTSLRILDFLTGRACFKMFSW